jgi:hypothetical protein
MKTVTRNSNILEIKSDFKKLITIKSFPVFLGCVKTKTSKDLFTDQTWQIDKKSGMIQLKKLIPLDILYKSQHTSGDNGNLWHKHHDSFCNFLLKYKNTKNIFEIGGAKGFLAKRYLSKKIHKDAHWKMIEPNPDLKFKDKRLKVIKSFFDEKYSENLNNYTVVHSHTLEHMYRPMKFIRDISNKMSIGARMIIAFPNMLEMLKRKYSNCINFEHTFFMREGHLKYMMLENNLKLIKKEKFLNDHSIFYCFEKRIDNSKKIKINYFKRNKKLFEDYIEYYKNLVKKINNKISNKSNKNKKVYLFGAHIFSQTLLNFGIDSKKIEYILDNDKTKQNKRLYGSSLKVKSPQILKKEEAPLVILKCGVYNDEIKNQILKNINSKATFL